MSRVNNPPNGTGHDVKRESRRRLVVGLSGLLAMLLLVLLAGLVTERVRQEADAARAQAEAAGVPNPGTPAANGNEPLADLGVAPSVDPGELPDQTPAAPAPAPSQATTTNGRVPDLQPDPRLEAPKSLR